MCVIDGVERAVLACSSLFSSLALLSHTERLSGEDFDHPPPSYHPPPSHTNTAGASGWHQFAVDAQFPPSSLPDQQLQWLLRAWYAAGVLEVSLIEGVVMSGML